MKNNNRKSMIIRIFLASLGLLLSMILVIIVTGYLILRSYIDKMNFIDLDKMNEIYEGYDEYCEYEDDDHDGGYYEYEDYSHDGDYYEYEGYGQDGKLYERIEDRQYVYGKNDNKAYSYGYYADKLYDEDSLKTKNPSDDNIFMSTSDIPLMEDKDVFNILLVGSDTRDTKSRGRSDAMMILSINKKKEKIILTSFLRDIYVEIPDRKSNRLNVAYSIGGPSLLIKTIENNFRIKIDRYASVDFFAFIDIVDAIGGVNISVTEEELPILNDYIYEINTILDEDLDKDILSTHGNYLLNGKQTLGYCRIRYIGTDFARTGRQRVVLEQIFLKVKNSNISKLNDLLNTILPKITTNLDEDEVISHVLNLKKYLGYDIIQWSVPVSGTYKNTRIRNMAVLDIDFKKNIEELRNRIY